MAIWYDTIDADDDAMGSAMMDAADEIETTEAAEAWGRSGGESSSGGRERMMSGCPLLRWPKAAACDEYAGSS